MFTDDNTPKHPKDWKFKQIVNKNAVKRKTGVNTFTQHFWRHVWIFNMCGCINGKYIFFSNWLFFRSFLILLLCCYLCLKKCFTIYVFPFPNLSEIKVPPGAACASNRIQMSDKTLLKPERTHLYTKADFDINRHTLLAIPISWIVKINLIKLTYCFLFRGFQLRKKFVLIISIFNKTF